MSVSLNTEIRKLKICELYTLGNILSISDAWKKLIAIVPKEGNFYKFNSEHIKIIEQTAHQNGCNVALVFLDEWSTMGKKRPTLETLLELLKKAELFRAADYIACDILKQEKPKRPTSGPAAPIDISDAAIKELLEQQMLQDISVNDSMILGSTEREINKIYSEDETVDNLCEAVNDNLPDVADELLHKEKTTEVLPKIISDLIKFSTTDNCEDSHTSSMVSEQQPSKNNEKEINKLENQSEIRQYYQEVSSRELPIFLNNPEQFEISNENISLENSSEYLPVFLKSPEQSATVPNEEMSSSELPLCLKQ